MDLFLQLQPNDKHTPRFLVKQHFPVKKKKTYEPPACLSFAPLDCPQNVCMNQKKKRNILLEREEKTTALLEKGAHVSSYGREKSSQLLKKKKKELDNLNNEDKYDRNSIIRPWCVSPHCSFTGESDAKSKGLFF